MKDDFFKFPSTPHLATLPGVDIRGDKVLSESERDAFLKHGLVVEEKVDGANLVQLGGSLPTTLANKTCRDIAFCTREGVVELKPRCTRNLF